MDILTCMSLGGSLMVVFYIIMKNITKNKLSYRERWLFLIGAIAVFLVPYPQERHQYMGLLQWLFPDVKWNVFLSDKISKDSYYIIENTNGEVLFRHDIRIYIIACFVIVGLIVIFGHQLYLNQKYKKNWMCAGKEETSRKLWRKEVKVFSSKEVVEPFSVGVLNPIIVIPEKSLKIEEKEMIIKHEMYHIREGDLILNCILVVLISVHWFNPLVYYLVYEIHHVQELRCDAKVTKGMDKEDCYQYANLILRFMHKKATKRPFISALSGSGKGVKERVNEIMMKKKVKVRISMVVVLLASVFMSTLTALAYAPAETHEISDEILGEVEDVKSYYVDGEEEFVVTGEESIYLDKTISLLKDKRSIFVTEDGRIYYCDENQISMQATSCTHSYENGQYIKHTENGVGCTVTVYEAKYCSKCERRVLTSVLSTTNYPKCPH